MGYKNQLQTHILVTVLILLHFLWLPIRLRVVTRGI